MYVLLVVGTRPQILKTAPLVDAVGGFGGLELNVVHTGQHYDYELSRGFFRELGLPDPLVNLGVGSGSHGVQTGRMLAELEKTFLEYNPDFVLVPGDTNSTLAAALAAVKLNIPVGHVESGCRSFDRSMPEEVNRIVTDHVSDVLFAVSETAKEQLLKEGIDEGAVSLVGDTMYESIVRHEEDIEGDDILERLEVDGEFYVATVHRAENTDDEARLRGIFEALLGLERQVVFPCHPRTRKRLDELGLLSSILDREGFMLVDPVGYFSMLKLVKEAEIVLTDSGGLQKEAFWLGTPCVTMRDNTEWTETVDFGMNRLVGADPGLIAGAVESFMEERPRCDVNPYDFGGASRMILESIMKSD